jgi:DNA (cytosine-5)-methyltransferase 1
MRRIARGLEKFVLNDPDPFIVSMSAPFISQSFGGGYTGSGRSVEKPLPTVTAVDHNHLVLPFLSQYHSYDDTPRGQTVKNPLLTLDGSNRYALIAPFMSHYYGASIGRRADEPVASITSQGQHIAEVRAFLIKYYGQGIGQSVNAPLGTLTGRDRFGLVTIKGKDYQIVDIGMRMLTPRECFNAHNFPIDYIIDRGADGKPMTKKEQTAKVGNSVVPLLAEALVRANLTDAVMTA